jgi:flagellar hook-associated protein 3 FlgL
MRVTNSMLNNNLIRNTAQSYRRLEELQETLASGKRIQKPSDDPVGISYSMRYRSELSMNEQYESNVADGISWLEFTDKVLSQATGSLNRARELAVQGANDSNSINARKAIAKEIDQIMGHMLNLSNSQLNGRYIFNGEKTDVKPFETLDDTLNVSADLGVIEYEIGRDVSVAINLNANEIFGVPTGGTGDGSDNVFQALKNLKDALNNDNSSGINQALGALDTRVNAILEQQAEVGARMNRYDMAQTRIEDQTYNYSVLLSKTEDADLAKVIIDLKQQENIHKAALSTGARMIQPSLVDFLR